MPYASKAQQRYFNLKASQGDPQFVKLARDFNTATYGRPGWTAGGTRTGAKGNTKGGPARFARLPRHVPRRGGAVASSTERLAGKMAASKRSGIYIKPSKQGSLHSALGVPQSQKIPASLINQRLAGSPSEAMRKKLQFAKNARSWG